ncbi:hypothetical protein AAFF_G00296340 [Aldrovandia affinis]|uniref:Uncharacterized protein n=1 Tax=Aldrovandia affinis TaxID=143900 RepID=A0AAD7SQD4_9TELE|nr:hypothetical protein AAFF_G00296340 [Aldrovandia affinis]
MNRWFAVNGISAYRDSLKRSLESRDVRGDSPSEVWRGRAPVLSRAGGLAAPVSVKPPPPPLREDREQRGRRRRRDEREERKAGDEMTPKEKDRVHTLLQGSTFAVTRFQHAARYGRPLRWRSQLRECDM